MPTPTLLRSAVSDLSSLAVHELRGIWKPSRNPTQIRDLLAEVLPQVVDVYGTAAATVAADWYDELRDGLNIAGRFSAIPTELGDTGGEELAGWGVGPLFSAEPDFATAQTLIEGGLQRRIADAARDTVIESSIADPSARGWQRETSGGCDFCEMLAGRGIVFSEESADFASHDHCQCYAVPAFDGEPKPVKAYTPSDRNITDVDRARVRDYLADHSDAG